MRQLIAAFLVLLPLALSAGEQKTVELDITGMT